MPILQLDKVTKRYRDHLAVDEVSFEVQPGTIFGMLGPNGAGKTSTIRIITTITGPDSGQVYFRGEHLNNTHPSQMGYLPEERGLYKKMKVGEHLLYLAQLKGLSRQEADKKCKIMLDRFEALEWWKKKELENFFEFVGKEHIELLKKSATDPDPSVAPYLKDCVEIINGKKASTFLIVVEETNCIGLLGPVRETKTEKSHFDALMRKVENNEAKKETTNTGGFCG